MDTPQPNESMANLHLTLEGIDCAERIVSLTEENANLQRMLEIAHQEALTARKQLAAVSYYNSHAVRGTLTRIWGLSRVIQHAKDKAEIRVMADLMHKEACYLDDVVRTVNSKLAEK